MATKRTAPAAPTTAKPRVTIDSDRHYTIKHLGLTGYVFKDSHGGPHWTACVDHGGSRSLESCAHHQWTAEAAGQRLLDRMAEINECRELLVAADKAEGNGARFRIERLGGKAAIEAYDAALKQLQADDVAGAITVRGMLTAVAKKKLPAKTTQAVKFWNGQTCNVEIIPGFSIAVQDHTDATRLHTYHIGEQAEYDSYNLHYFGTIERIAAKTVTIRAYANDDSCKRLDLHTFARRNNTDANRKHDRNVTASYYL